MNNNSQTKTSSSSGKARYKPTPLDYKQLHFLVMGSPDPNQLQQSIQVSSTPRTLLADKQGSRGYPQPF